MIENFKSKALKLFYYKGDESKINPHHQQTIRDILDIMEASSSLNDVASLPCNGFHPWKGQGKNGKIWSLDVNGNFRILFRFDKTKGSYCDIDYTDPHS